MLFLWLELSYNTLEFPYFFPLDFELAEFWDFLLLLVYWLGVTAYLVDSTRIIGYDLANLCSSFWGLYSTF